MGKSSGSLTMRRILGNFGHLLRGHGIGAVMSFGAMALMARALGPAEFGLVVLIQTYAQLVRGLLNFKQFQGIVRYGVPLQDKGEIVTLRRLISISQRVDLFACVIATVTAFLLAPLIGPLMDMDHEYVMLLTLYTLVILSTGNNTALGILRLHNKFDVLGRQVMIGPAISFFGVTFAWWFDSPVYVFVAIMALAYVAENVYLTWVGRREYISCIGHPDKGELVTRARMSEFSGLRHFIWVTYWQSNLDLVPKRVSIMLAGYLLGASEAGLLRLARQIASLLSKPAALVRQVVFPDLTRSWHQGNDDFKMIAYRTAMIGGAFGMLFVLVGFFFGEGILGILFGQEYIAAASVLTLLLLAGTFDLTASSLRSAAYAIGHAGKVLNIHAVAAVIYLGLFVALTIAMGFVGTGVAACIAAVIPPIAMANLIHKSVRTR